MSSWHQNNSDILLPYVKAYLDLIEENSKTMTSSQLMEWIYESIDKVSKDPKYKENVTCKKGCSFCCHDRIFLTQFEADYFKHRMKGKITVNSETALRRQNLAEEFYTLSWTDKKCTLLGKDGTCSVYEDRPIVCRLHNSTSKNAKLCKVDSKGMSGDHGQIYAVQAEALHLALGLASGERGQMLHEVVKEIM